MANFKKYGSLILTFIFCFNLGAYASSIIKYNEHIELYELILNSFFGLMFLLNFLIENKK